MSSTYQGDFEVHLTVRAAAADPVDAPEPLDSLEAFNQWCREQQVKCIRIVLARGEHVEQPMATWRRAETHLPAVIEEAHEMARSAEKEGLTVTRVKVEAAPQNQDVPVADIDAQGHPPDNYFEHHVKLQRAVEQSEDALTDVCLRHGAHLSRNAFRQSADGLQERFVTLRSYGIGRDSSVAALKSLMADLEKLQEVVLETESEYCVYDSNLALDDGWLD